MRLTVFDLINCRIIFLRRINIKIPYYDILHAKSCESNDSKVITRDLKLYTCSLILTLFLHDFSHIYVYLLLGIINQTCLFIPAASSLGGRNNRIMQHLFAEICDNVASSQNVVMRYRLDEEIIPWSILRKDELCLIIFFW